METNQNVLSDYAFGSVNLLSLDQLCLERIVTYLDCASFHSMLLTCKKLSSFLAALPIRSWNNGLLYRRGIYLLLHIVFPHCHDKQLMTNIIDTLTKALDGSHLLTSVAPSRIIETWNTFGPVLGKLHSLVILHRIKEEPWPEQTYRYFHRYVTLELPSGKHLDLQQSFFRNFVDPRDNRTALRAVIDSTSASYYYQSDNSCFRDSDNWYWHFGEPGDSEDCTCLNPIGSLLQEEVGEVVPSGIDGESIKALLLCIPLLQFPGLQRPGDDGSNTLEELILKRFRNEQLNKMVEVELKAQYLKKQQTIARDIRKILRVNSGDGDCAFQEEKSSCQTAERTLGGFSTISFQKQDDADSESSGGRFQEFGGTTGSEGSDSRSKEICEFIDLVSVLALRGDCIRLKCMNSAFGYFQAMKDKLSLTKDHELFQSLLCRVNFDTIEGPWNEYGEQDFSVDFKLCGPHILSFNIIYYESRWGSQSSVFLRFHIPTLNINVQHTIKRSETNELLQGLSCLSPITAEIQKCIDRDCQKGQIIVPYPEWPRYFIVPGPRNKVTNAFVATFFVLLSGITALYVDEQCMAEEFFIDNSSGSDYEPLTIDDSSSDETDENSVNISSCYLPRNGANTETCVSSGDARPLNDPAEANNMLKSSPIECPGLQVGFGDNLSSMEAGKNFEVYYGDDSDIEIDPEELDDLLKDEQNFRTCEFDSKHKDDVMD